MALSDMVRPCTQDQALALLRIVERLANELTSYSVELPRSAGLKLEAAASLVITAVQADVAKELRLMHEFKSGRPSAEGAADLGAYHERLYGELVARAAQIHFSDELARGELLKGFELSYGEEYRDEMGADASVERLLAVARLTRRRMRERWLAVLVLSRMRRYESADDVFSQNVCHLQEHFSAQEQRATLAVMRWSILLGGEALVEAQREVLEYTRRFSMTDMLQADFRMPHSYPTELSDRLKSAIEGCASVGAADA